ncbi:glycosyhydrolase [Segetibacter sp. 3557_3]|uniref:glycosyl hydrolase 115 family protein n=1 Tax=Segetibacter sp. 3557_3 TaxID=2547429 RepID=UPI00105904F0|nr:glycosyl hydrolase 115 family protein [Segetibacter sp. 3557_3]TDH27337.1 glycosyhydrolase [Segetibacter sp. 3557_3]
MRYTLVLILLFCGARLNAQNFVFSSTQGAFPLADANGATSIYVDDSDHWLVQQSAQLLAGDIEKVTGHKSIVLHELPTQAANLIIVGSLNKSGTIKRLISAGKLKTGQQAGKWDGYQYGVVTAPFKNIGKALVITGSDKRGTAYGIFDIASEIGVSPWYWWADVPIVKQSAIYLRPGVSKADAPSVKYRGIFINDEAPAFSGWTKEKFGGVNHTMYEKMFELLLRMKANYLWPAMWGNAFNDDDTLNPVLADKYGIVMGTSHHEPMLRAQQEWKRYGKGVWNYTTNDSVLRSFWRKGIENMGTHESIVTIGMRGDGDEPMTSGTATELLERIVKDQRKIIGEVTGKDPAQTPQLWALYKEVQDYYDKGMRVPGDVTLLLCDDNWGNIRKLPKKGEKHPGGYGIYYHFDYVGGPRNYKWINTNQIERTWEQMHLAYEYGVDRIWIVNVGDLKPMEFPINFFLDYAWKPEQWPAEKLPDYYTMWATKQFGKQHAKEIGNIIALYSKYNSRRKPELLSPDTYSLANYNEAERVVVEYNQLLARAQSIAKQLPAAYHDAYYQLVLHPVQASANLNELYLVVAKNREYAKLGLPGTNALAERAKALYVKDSLISNYYNDTLAGGKWRHMMDQTHIGYTYWQQPLTNAMPQVKYLENDNTGNVKWLDSLRLAVNSSSKQAQPNSGKVFSEKDGYISIEAPHYSKAVGSRGIQWQVIPNLGRTSSAITPFPVTADKVNPAAGTPALHYDIELTDADSISVQIHLSPTLNFHNEGLRFAISIDDQKPQVINMHEGNFERQWNQWVADNIILKTSKLGITKGGAHTIKYWMVDPGVVLQKLVIDTGGLKKTYLGPPETK